MAGSFKLNKQVFAFSSDFYRQDDFLTPLDDSVIDARHPQIDATFPRIERTRRTRFDCNDVDIIQEIIDTEFARKRFRFPATAELLTGHLAFNYGAIAAPTGTPADEVQTLQASGTVSGGTFKITFTLEGITDQTDDLAFNANAATVQAALNALRSIQRGGENQGSVACVGSIAAGMTVTFGGRLAKADMPALVIDNTAITGGGTIAVTETTKGTNKKHVGSRGTSDVLPYYSFIEGFLGDTTDPLEWYGFASDAIIIEAAKGGDLFITVELVGRADAFEVAGYAFPNCVNVTPINTKDCRVRVNNAFVAEGLSSFRFERRNNIVVSAEAFAFDSVHLEVNERGARPTESFSYSVRGSRGDDHYTDAFNETTRDVAFFLGEPKERVSLLIPQGNLKLGDPDISFDGELQKSVINVVGQPYLDNTLQASSNFEANISDTDTYMTTAP